MTKSNFALTVTLSLSTLAVSAASLANELEWNNLRAIGGGNGKRCFFKEGDSRSNVEMDVSGNNVTFVFDSFGIDLKRKFGGGPLKYDASCNVEADVTIPQGYYIATLTQSLIVGIRKDPGTTGGLSSNGFLFQTLVPVNQINLPLGPKLELDTPLYDGLAPNKQIFDSATIAAQCAATASGPMQTVFKFQLLAAGVRPLPMLRLQVNVDSGDLSYGLQPTLLRCPGA